RNWDRKDNKYFSLDWRVQWPIKVGKDMTLMPMIEMFNTFNNDNNINTLSTPALFDFSGFLRLGVGDPRQVQLPVKFTFQATGVVSRGCPSAPPFLSPLRA